MNPLKLPKLTQHVSDFSGVLTRTQIESFSEQLAEHETKTTEQVTIVLFPHREGHELLDIGLKIFNENGIGQKNLNNGLLLIVATDEKKIRIITGKGMEIKYSEMRCRDIIENHIRPFLDNEKYEELIGEWIKYITADIDIEKLPEGPSSGSVINIIIIGILSVINFGTYGILMLISFWIGGFDLEKLFGSQGGLLYGGISFMLFIASIYLAINFFVNIFGGYIDNYKPNYTKVFKKIPKIFLNGGMIIYGIIILILFFIGLTTQLKCAEIEKTRDIIKTQCEREVFGKKYQSQESNYTQEYKALHPEKFESTSSSSSSSSFGGGGGSSNGGGYGD